MMMVRRTFAVGLALLISLGAARGAMAGNEKLDLGGGASMEVVPIRAGKFVMGSPEAEAGRRKDEKQHEAKIAEDFLIGKTPVTRGQFARFATAANYRTEAEVGNSGGFGVMDGKLVQKKEFTWKKPGFEQTDDHPVVMVTLKDAQAFCKWMSKQTGRTVALPTEAQWEYACRAGTASRFCNGDREEDAKAIAWFDTNAEGATHAVGQKRANAWGLVDMSGNVFEWCSDVYGPYEAGGAVVGDMDKVRNVLRGGSFLRPIGDVRSAARYRNAPGSRNADNGFRVVVSKLVVESPAAPVAPVKPAEQPPAPLQAEKQVSISMPRQIAPAAPYTPVSSRTVSMEGQAMDAASIPFGCLIPVIFVAVLAFIVYRIVVSLRQGNVRQGNDTPRRPMVTQMAEDGFWIDNAAYRVGDVVTYTYETDDGPVTGQFTVQSGGGAYGQFVYTGARPVNVVLGAMAAQHMASQMHRHVSPPPVQQHVQEEPRSSSGFRGFPSAY